MDVFIIKLILSFVVGSSYAILSTVTADRLGTKIGGLISGLPSTVLFGLLFIAWTQSTKASVEATTLIPAVIGLACVYLVTYIHFVKRNLWLAILMSIVIWLILAYGLIIFHVTNFLVSVFIYIFCYLVAYAFVTFIFKVKSTKGNKIVYSPRVLFLRGLLSGSIVALSVIIAKVGGPIFGGMVATFPAMFTSTLLINANSEIVGRIF